MSLSIAKLVRSVSDIETIVTNPVNEWLLRHGDDAFSQPVLDFVSRAIGTPPRIRTGSFSGASAGMCLRRQELAYAGTPGEVIDPQLRNIFNDGKWRHVRWQAMMLETGIITDAEYLVEWDEMLSRGSLDGRGEVPDDHPVKRWRGLEFGFELKGVSTFQYGRMVREGVPPKHARQIHHYFVLGAFDLFSYVIEDKTTQSFKEFVIEPDAKLMVEAENDIRELAKAVKNKKLHKMLPECQGKAGEFMTCPFGKNNGTCVAANTNPPKEFSRT